MTAFAAIKWARSAPILRRGDGKPDSTAHHVLLALATFADRDGRARPSVATLADATTLADRTVVESLRRLEDAGLIKSEGKYGGTGAAVWMLVMDTTRSETDGDLLGRRSRKREATAARVAKFRLLRKEVTPPESVTDDLSNAPAERYVTPSDGVTELPVTPSHDIGNAVGQRYVTPSDDKCNAVDCVTSADQSPRTAIELPVELPLNCHALPTAAQRARNSYPPEFEEFWAAYGRKGAKRAAGAEWTRAVKRADPTTILAAVPAYVASTPNPRYRKDAERWLKGDCWESTVVPIRAAGDYQPYRNPIDQSVYHEDL